MEFLPKEALVDALTYDEYRTLVTNLFKAGKTTGPKQTPGRIEATKMNEQRIQRIQKTFQLDDEAARLLPTIDRPMLWLVLTEGWCGDAAQIVPVLYELATRNPHIKLRFLLRDEHPEIMDAFLTDGTRSIPKVIFAEDIIGQVLGDWGPRPVVAQEMMRQFKADMAGEGRTEQRRQRYEEVKYAIHSWYSQDRTVSIQREVLKACVGVLA